MTASFYASLLLSILLAGLVKLNPLNRFITPIFSPLATIRQFISQQQTTLASLPKISAENQELKAENSHLKIIVKKLSESVNNQELIKKINARPWQIVPVKLVRLDNLATMTSLDLSGIQPGQAVVSADTLVGIVKKVEPPIVTVSPLDSADVKIDAQLEDGSQGRYLIKNGFPTITNLDNNTAFSPRTSVFTLPTNLIPENLLIGQITEIITNPSNPVQEAHLALDQSIATARNLFIITKP